MNPATIAAIYTFAAHYRSGQWSRGYRLLCRARRAWKRRTAIEPRLDYWEGLIKSSPDSEVTRLYRKLEAGHAGNL